MSNLDTAPTGAVGAPGPCDGPVAELLEPRTVLLGRTTQVRRLLPHRVHRMVGAWCFVDHYGPDDVRGLSRGRRRGMWVPPHPHTGLQTVSWLLEGQVLHRDSLGSLATLRPGALGLMTAGHGISHSEESPGDRDPVLHGAQLWLALPDAERDRPPSWDHVTDLPALVAGGARVVVFVGSLAVAGRRVTSPAPVHTPLVGADAALDGGAAVRLDVDPRHEHAVLAVGPGLVVEGTALAPGQMLHLGTGRDTVGLSAVGGSGGGPADGSGDGRTGARGLLLGGEPFDSDIVMWWNFVGRSHDEVVAMRREWQETSGRFGAVRGFDGPALPAPTLPTTRLRSRGRTR